MLLVFLFLHHADLIRTFLVPGNQHAIGLANAGVEGIATVQTELEDLLRQRCLMDPIRLSVSRTDSTE